jgi:hypothetical protein
MTAILRNCFVVLLAFGVLACAIGTRGRGAPEGGSFFGADVSKLQKGSGDDWARVYRSPAADFPSYDKLILDPVGIWSDADGGLKKVSATDRQRIANNFQTLIYKSVSRYFTMVSEPGPRTLRLRTALTNAQASSRTLDTISTVIPQLRVPMTLTGYATGKPAFTGQAAFAFRLTDAQTGETLSIGTEKRVGAKTLSGATDSWADVNNALEYWANLSGYRICTAKRLANCVKPKEKRAL